MCVFAGGEKYLYVHQKKAFVGPFLEEMETDANLTLVYSSAFSLLILNFKSAGGRAQSNKIFEKPGGNQSAADQA